MDLRRLWKSTLAPLLLSPWTIAALLVACLVLGFALTAVASITEVGLEETYHFEGQVSPFAEGMDALEVSNASYAGHGFGEARTTTDLECGVGVVFLTVSEWMAFQDTGGLPVPQLHCSRASASLPGTIAAVFVENQRQTGSNWSFDLNLYRVAYPNAVYGLPAIGLLMVGGLGLPVMILQKAIPRWIESQFGREKKE